MTIGTLTGFGNNLVQEVLEKGDIAVATARKPKSLKFKGTSEKNFLALKLDVTQQADIDSAFKSALEKFKRVDAVKPSGGLIQPVTSVGRQVGVPTFGIYCTSKWAVEAFTETISQEVKPDWRIKFTLIEPGGFRTDFSGRSMASPEKRNPAYDHIDTKKNKETKDGTQPGDPVKAAKAMYELAVSSDPPLRTTLGSDGYEAISKKVEKYKENLKKFEKMSKSTDIKR
ncbi:hypothetical protein BKA65DRAFT_609330 [Rhexocercosporidium sp. MPI-PUGE-AT-0058]|nr:hypothetical protein BKA65DRAFT_609330 [Rhexocercosporidium sp. MPI-PUGE-AT-0058]